MDSLKKKFHVTPIDNVGPDEYQKIYDLSVCLCDYITEQVKNEKSGELPDYFWWLKTCATRPAFHHLCFVYKATVYSFLIGIVEDEQIQVLAKDWNNFQNETKKYGLQACLIPVKIDDLSVEVLPYLDANTLEPIIFNKENLNEPLSEWELYCMGVNNVVNHLNDNNATKISYCDIPEIYPSIWFTDDKGKSSYVLVRSVAAGHDEDPYSINKNMIDKYKEEGFIGYFANINWVNLRGNNGNFKDEQVFHYHFYNLCSTQIELEQIEDVEKNHPNIKFEDKDMYEL